MPTWFVVRDGTEQGPLSSEQLRKLVIAGRVRPDDLLRRDDIPKRVRAGAVKGLFSTETAKSGLSPGPDQNRIASAAGVAPVQHPKPPDVAAGREKRRRLLPRGLLIGLSLAGCVVVVALLLKPFADGRRDRSTGAAAPVGSASNAKDNVPGNSLSTMALPPLPTSPPANDGDYQVTHVAKPLRVLPNAGTDGLRISSDGSYLLANSTVWNLKTGNACRPVARDVKMSKAEYEGGLDKDGHCPKAEFSPDGNLIATFSRNGKTLLLVSPDGDKLVVRRSFPLERDDLRATTWSPTGKSIALDCEFYQAPHNYHGMILHFDEAAHRIVTYSYPFGGSVEFRHEYPWMLFSPNGQYLAVPFSEPNGKSVCVFDAATGRNVIRIPFAQGDDIYVDAFSGDSGHLGLSVRPYKNEAIKIWATSTWKEVLSFPTEDKLLCFMDDGKSFLTKKFDSPPTYTVRSISDGSAVSRTAASPVLDHVAVVEPRDDGQLEVRGSADDRLVAVLGNTDKIWRSMRSITADGKFVASASPRAYGVEIWDTSAGVLVPASTVAKGPAVRKLPDTPAPPVSERLFALILEGMSPLEIKQLLGGKPLHEASGVHEGGKLGTDWIHEIVQFYAVEGDPNSVILLQFRGRGSGPPLVAKMKRRR